LILRIANPGGVDQAKLNAFDIEDFFDGVARGAGDFADDGALLIEEGIEEGRLTSIGASGDDGIDAVFDGIAELERLEEVVDEFLDFIDQGFEVVSIGKFYIFFSEIEFEFDEAGKGISSLKPPRICCMAIW